MALRMRPFICATPAERAAWDAAEAEARKHGEHKSAAGKYLGTIAETQSRPAGRLERRGGAIVVSMQTMERLCQEGGAR